MNSSIQLLQKKTENETNTYQLRKILTPSPQNNPTTLHAKLNIFEQAAGYRETHSELEGQKLRGRGGVGKEEVHCIQERKGRKIY